MAPAPPEADRDSDRALHRRALTSVDNLALHMEDDDMGLQQPNLAKDSVEMEQILNDLGTGDLAPGDLLQAIKTLETAGDSLSTGDTDVIFPLPGFDLAETIESEGDASEDKIKVMQVRLERRCAFLERRLRLLQARAIGKRVAEEVGQTFEKCARSARKDVSGRTMGLKALLKRVETTAALQASAAAKNTGPKHLMAGTSKMDVSKSASLGIPQGTLTGLEDTAGALRTHLSVVKHELDSDATLSSSGAESNDEAVPYNNPHQQHLPIEKRALWTWQRARASIAARWSWLQAQVQELDYKIRQHTELHKKVREAKGPAQFEGEPAAYQGALPGADDAAPPSCARARPLRRDAFKKRRLLQMHNLHTATAKAAKPTDIRCSCMHPAQSCAVCTGRADAAAGAAGSLGGLGGLPPRQARALRDPGYHAVLSDENDITASLQMETLLADPTFATRALAAAAAPAPRKPPRPGAAAAGAPGPPAAPGAAVTPVVKKEKKIKHLKRGRPPSKKPRDRDDDGPSTHERVSRHRHSTERAPRRASYDIDNIVIPQSVAAATRPEILHYKEIITPQWRVIEPESHHMNNGVSKHRLSVSEDEDVSDGAVLARHSRSELSERRRYVRKAPRRSAHSDAPPEEEEWSDAGAGRRSLSRRPRARRSRHSSSTESAETPYAYELIRPYSPRAFPLTDATYTTMLAAMPAGHQRRESRGASPAASPAPRSDDGTLSPLSPLAYAGDDPDDLEWDPTREKTDRRKSHAYR